MDRPLTVITGSRKGIGRFLAEHYLRRGHRVVGCSRGEAGWDSEGYTHYLADVSDEGGVRQLFARVRKEHGHIENLINNAGIASMNHALLTPLSTVERVLQTNVAGTFLFCREAAKVMKTKRYGRIVNFTTVAVPLKLEGEAAYVSSKAAVQALTEVLARELGGYGITVNAVGPCPVKTDLIRGVPEKKIAQLVARQAIQRYGTYEDIANVVDFFLDKNSSMVTGQSLFLGGV